MSDNDDWRTLYPFRSHELMLDGVRYHYLDEGTGETLLLVHGNPTWSFYWRDIVTALRGRYRLIVPDHIGCGLSDKPQNYRYELAQHVANLRRLIEQLDLTDVTLLAHDWGGAIGLGAAVAEPSRFARLVLFNTAAFRSTRMPLRIRVCRTPILGTLAVRGLNAFARAAIRMAVEDHTRMTPAVKQGFLAPYDNWSHRVAIDRFVRDIPLTPRHPSYQMLAGIESRLHLLADRPTMLVWGMRDWCFTPHFLERFRNEFFPDAEVHEVADAGHYVVLDAQERIVVWFDEFLNRHPLRGAVGQRGD
jgi:haloalkane dehalogenase